jgi:hypothetical protein
MGTILRHGDVILEATELVVSEGAVKAPGNAYGVVLAQGTATGHSHVLSGGRAELYTEDGKDYRILRVFEVGTLTHEEHADIQIEPGTYLVSIKRQYTEDDRGWADVQD